jgi:hypothetical protein
MEINEYDLLDQTNLVQYDKLREHDEDKLIVENHWFCFLVHYDEKKLSKQV